ncbi:MAG TPA: hypothetical protein VKV16_06760 [Solirubrobacteraceae bacterium]|nr:hypothetical protein [Solirubrobacteraceae bacterium]
MVEDERFEREQEQAAASEAASIGGIAGDEELEDAQRPVLEAGGGESEGFELAEQDLIEHASHGDQQSAHAILHHQGIDEEASSADDQQTGDHERSSEREAEE